MDRLVILFSITRRHITQVDLYLSSNFSNAEGTSYVIVYNYIIFHRLQKYQFSRILLMLLLTCYSSIVWNSMKIVLYFLNSEDNFCPITEEHHIPSNVMGGQEIFSLLHDTWYHLSKWLPNPTGIPWTWYFNLHEFSYSIYMFYHNICFLMSIMN